MLRICVERAAGCGRTVLSGSYLCRVHSEELAAGLHSLGWGPVLPDDERDAAVRARITRQRSGGAEAGEAQTLPPIRNGRPREQT